jgi:hypothetical protein
MNDALSTISGHSLYFQRSLAPCTRYLVCIITIRGKPHFGSSPCHLPGSPVFSLFYYDEDILEELTTPDCPWNVLHHRELFLSQEAFSPSTQTSICAIKTKDFIPLGHTDWFNNPIPALDSFEDDNMANIFPTVKIDISIKLGIVEEITIGTSCSPEEIIAYKSLFQEYLDIFAWSYMEMSILDPSIVEHRINTWPNITLVCQKQQPLCIF